MDYSLRIMMSKKEQGYFRLNPYSNGLLSEYEPGVGDNGQGAS